VGSLAAINFDKAFEIFHAVLFPGKDNWMFDWSTDQLLWILPQEFFRNCGILIGAGILIFSGTLIAVNLCRHFSKTEGKK
jgi:integral membrane protein (TIGR01906 family)